jgi:catalase
VYAPNSFGGPHADPAAHGDDRGWQNDGELIRAAATLHPEDDDFVQARTLVNEVLDDAARDRLVSNIAGHVSKVTIPELRDRVLLYWSNVDVVLGRRVAEALPPIAEPRTSLVGEPAPVSR